ncbi:mannose-1-phosphate guanylyltransferase [Clostridium polynesiense]|uniref:mannose-1-phosphate guanylyltransferase n=1 Tax=Clostridium polynesiense TaxID=1325933 RepID=UPI00058DF3DD|nr:mannose-1-phosphate guanylyltransferase [Clostridium polynesiense]
MLCALIMAGGKGTRFWPLSTEEHPKQFLKLLGNKTMIQLTVDRLLKLIPMEQIFIVTSKKYVGLVKDQIPEILDRNIIIEPVGKNTAPCISLSAFIINKYYSNSTLIVVPSDHLIHDEDEFIEELKSAASFIEKDNDAIITLGITPTRPETGYGYIKSSINVDKINMFHIKKVDNFIEKPSINKAMEYVQDESYLWNSGMFIWKVQNIIKLTQKHLNNTYNLLHEIAICKEEDFNEKLEYNYSRVESISVDYAIMEKTENIYVIPSSFGWDDVGNWSSIERYRDKDINGNVHDSNSFMYNSKNNIVITNKKTLLNNVRDLIIVETSNHILISSKDHEQYIKEAKTIVN